MTVSKLDRAEVEALWDHHSGGIRHFVLGVLRDAELADEALQQTFVTAIEQGHTADRETQKGWLYRVAFNHAMTLKRRATTRHRAFDQLKHVVATLTDETSNAESEAMRSETIESVKRALTRLPDAQRTVVEMRLRDAMTFQAIADSLGIPLSTALTRMRLAMDKLRNEIK